jgi:hypothetical protein
LSYCFVVSLAIIRSTYLLIISCSLSNASSSYVTLSSGTFPAGSFPLFDFYCAAGVVGRYIVLGPGASKRLVVVAG